MRLAVPGLNLSLTLSKVPAWRVELAWHGQGRPGGERGVRSIPTSYTGDGLQVRSRTLDALHTARFSSAYQSGMATPHSIGGGGDLHIEWRVYTCLWAAEHGLSLAGDFVECGVNTGILSLSICEYLNFAESGRQFFLFDTFEGIPEHQAAPGEREAIRSKNARIYRSCYEQVQETFAPYPNVRLIRGTVPETLSDAAVDKVAYLSIDMNLAYPEVQALEFFWPKLVPGAIVVLDDYAFAGHRPQYDAINAFAARRHVPVYTSPTGQGLIIRPPQESC
jgi:O-methyltransferase